MIGDGKLSARRDPPPLRFGTARSCIVSSIEVGRDVGLAKSGLRPTIHGLRLAIGYSRSALPHKLLQEHQLLHEAIKLSLSSIRIGRA